MLVVVHNPALLNVHLNSNVKSPTEKENENDFNISTIHTRKAKGCLIRTLTVFNTT